MVWVNLSVGATSEETFTELGISLCIIQINNTEIKHTQKKLNFIVSGLEQHN